MQDTTNTQQGQLVAAMNRIETEVREGLTHGHFDIEISGSMGNGKVRELIVKTGKKYRFRIAEEELHAEW